MFKKLALLPLLFVVLFVFAGCGAQTAKVNTQKHNGKPIVVLINDGQLSNLNGEQKYELNRVLEWQKRDIIKQLKRAHFDAQLIERKQDYRQQDGLLWILTVKDFNAGNRALRAFVGYGAGSTSLDMKFDLQSPKGKSLDQWEDGVGSSKGGTYCAQTLNRRGVERVISVLNKQ